VEVITDVVLMDIDMPHVDGPEGVILLRKQFPDHHILMQTVFEDTEKIFDAILAGANGYLLKQTAPAKLLLAIEEVMEGGAPMTPVVAKSVLAYCANKQSARTPEEFHLSGRELQILLLLVDGYSYKLIAEQCDISVGTVNTHVSHIYEKLHEKNAASAVSVALREGLV
jgi:DNA-binding NarL/FixJ family response regulator